MIAAAWAAATLAGLCCAAWAIGVLRGRKRLACLRRSLAIRSLVIWTLAAIAAVRLWHAARHPLRYAGYLRARAVRRIPRRDPDGEPLGRDDMRAFIAIVQCWKHPVPERTPHP